MVFDSMKKSITFLKKLIKTITIESLENLGEKGIVRIDKHVNHTESEVGITYGIGMKP
jgi:hypothetical protein